MSWMAFPYAPRHGRTFTRDDSGHARDMLEMLLFTTPGERVNRPEFGCGLNQMLFAGNSPELQGTVEMTVRAAVQRCLGDVLTIESLAVRVEDSTLEIALAWRLIATGEGEDATFTRSLA